MKILPNRIELARLLPKDGAGAELGTHQGIYAAVLLAEARPKVLHLVDNFTVTIQGIDGPAAQAATRERFKTELTAGTVRLHVQDTFAWLVARPASSLAWLYIDATHSDFHVYRELCQAFRVVKAGGWIAGHDYTAACTPGVVSAVDRFCEQHGQRLEYVTDEPEFDLQNRQPWQPHRAAFNSFALQVSK